MALENASLQNNLLVDGSGDSLNPAILLSAAICTAVATVVAAGSIYLQLKNYRKPVLQRMVVRIMLMVPIYAIASLIALYSLEAAFVIDAIRDIYEAFVIYCFFHLLLAYLGGERSLLILLYGRPPKPHLFPVNIFKREIDCSDPFTFLTLRRGILQYVQVKPILAAVTLILKAAGVYNEGSLKASSGYLWVSIVYNTSICISLYCLAMFWVCVNDDLKPFRPVPKFLCVKGILFFSFWQAIGISILVAAGAIKQIGPYTDPEHISLAIVDFLICFEMPFFAFAHMFAFSHTDYIDKNTHYAARMPVWYAARDAFGLLDVLEDSRATLKGGVSYRHYEPVEGGMHQGAGRNRRIKAGLRYAKGGQQKYWLPMPADETVPVRSRGPIDALRNAWDERRAEAEGYAPLLEDQEDNVVHEDYSQNPSGTATIGTETAFNPPTVEDPDEPLRNLAFDPPDEDEDALYTESKRLLFGDYNYPCIDVSTEEAKMLMWDEEERILSDRRAAAFSPIRADGGIIRDGSLLAAQVGKTSGYGAVDRGKASIKGSVFGGIAEEVHTPGSTSSSKVQDKLLQVRRPGHGEATIDMDPGARPDLQVDGVTLQWTKRGDVMPQSPKESKKPKPSTSRNSTTSDLQAPRPLVPSSQNSSSSNVGRTSSPMPSDAVDLVVEDPKAAEEVMAYERRKGEPAVRQTGQRKIYRTAYTIEDEEDGEKKEVDVTHEVEPGIAGPDRGDSPEIDRTKVEVKSEHGGWEDAGSSGWRQDVSEVNITRAATPPPHAVLEVNKFSTPINYEDESNPWG